MIPGPELQWIGIFALAIVLPVFFGLVKHFTAKPDFTPEDREKLNDLYEWHNQRDGKTGVFRWYHQQKNNDMIERMSQLMLDLHYGQKEVTANLERMTKLLDKLIDRVDHIEKHH